MPRVPDGAAGGRPPALSQQPSHMRSLLCQPEGEELPRVQGPLQELVRGPRGETSEEQTGGQGAGAIGQEVQVSLDGSSKLHCW